MPPARPEKILAVDFGTSTCSAGIHGPRGAKLILENGEAAIPSALYFPRRGDPILGSEAQRRFATEPTNTVRSVKRLLGRSFDDPTVAQLGRRLYYGLKEGPGGSVVLGLDSGDIAVDQVVAHIFRALRDLAEQRFACFVRKVVATVPADASPSYEKALERAAKIARLEVIETLPEPVAGALPMRLHLEDRDRRVLVCDFGGGTFDATLIDAGYRRLDVLATAGDDSLGGDDFDVALTEAVAGVIHRSSARDLLRDHVLRHQLQMRCEFVKRALSSREEVHLKMPNAYRIDGQVHSIDLAIKRDWAEKTWIGLVDRASHVIEALLARLGMALEQVDQVALIGGTSQVPLFRRRVTEMFGPDAVIDGVGPATAVAEGAILRCGAYEAAVIKSAPPLVAEAR